MAGFCLQMDELNRALLSHLLQPLMPLAAEHRRHMTKALRPQLYARTTLLYYEECYCYLSGMSTRRGLF